MSKYLFMLALMLTACDGELVTTSPASDSPLPSPDMSVVVIQDMMMDSTRDDGALQPVDMSDASSDDMDTDMAPDMEVVVWRTPQRLSVDHLRRSIPRLFGEPLMVTLDDGSQVDFFDHYAQSMGEADFQTIRHDQREPSALFSKLLDDAAFALCERAVRHDLAAQAGEPRHIIHVQDDLRANLAWLKLKLHGVHVEPSCDEVLTRYEALHDRVEQQCEEEAGVCPRGRGWMAVCTAMVTEPEFLVY